MHSFEGTGVQHLPNKPPCRGVFTQIGRSVGGGGLPNTHDLLRYLSYVDIMRPY